MLKLNVKFLAISICFLGSFAVANQQFGKIELKQSRPHKSKIQTKDIYTQIELIESLQSSDSEQRIPASLKPQLAESKTQK